MKRNILVVWLMMMPLIYFSQRIVGTNSVNSTESLASISSNVDLQKANAVSNEQVDKVHFIENKGQIKQLNGDEASFVSHVISRGAASIFLLKEAGIAWQISKVHYPEGYLDLISGQLHSAENAEKLLVLQKQIRTETYRMDMHLVGANPNAVIISSEKSEDYTSYYNHNALNVHHFKKVTYKDVYPGIDWVIYSKEEGVKYDFVVHPGANPNQIQLDYTNQEELYIDAKGNLVQRNRMGQFTEDAPISFQGKRQIETHFSLKNNRISFVIGDYEKSSTLILDPLTREWATYYGGTNFEYGYSCATDLDGNVYLSGSSFSSNAIASVGHQNTLGGSFNAFLVKFNSAGVRQWATYYGGVWSTGTYCSTDNSGNIYLAGHTQLSANLASGGHQNTYGGGFYDAFLVKFNSSGVRQWATFYGGTSDEYNSSCATDALGNVYLAGSTDSPSNIASGGHQNTFGGGGDAYLVKFNSAGVRQWATFYGGMLNDGPGGCATDALGNVYLSGQTRSPSNIASGGHQNTFGGGIVDGFLVKFNSSGIRQWATYYGGASTDFGINCTVDGLGNVYFAGQTESTSNIASGGHQNTHGGGTRDGFLVKFNSSGVRQWATYYGGNLSDNAHACAINSVGDVLLAGSADSPSNIAFAGYQNTIGGARDAFLVRFNSAGVRQRATYYGGADTDYSGSGSISIDISGNIYLSGTTSSPSSISFNGHQNSIGSISSDAFLVKFTTITPLPVGFSDFDYSCDDETQNLRWNVEWEQNCGHYAICISRDGIEFETVGTVAGHGSISESLEYNYTLPTTIGISYVKIIQVDESGNKIEYGPFSLECDLEEALLYPNSVVNYFNLSVPSNWRDTEIQITDLNGRKIMELTHDFKASKVVLVDATNLSQGSYLISIRSGGHFKTLRFEKINL